MATEKNINSRILHKHDIETNWNKAIGFIPKAGELIIYDVDSSYDYCRLKIGNGTTNVINLPFIDTNLIDLIDNKVDKVSGKNLSTNDYTTIEKNKLANIAANAEVNQNAFSNIIVNSTTIAADNKTDSLTLAAGSNINLAADVNSDKITISATDTTYSIASSSTDGLMSAADKKKLDGIATGATANTGDITDVTAGNGLTGGGSSGSVTLAVGAGTGINVTADAVSLATIGTAGTYGPTANISGSNGTTVKIPQITTDAYGRVTSVTERVYTSVDNNTTYSAATISTAGLMSAADKTKLDGIATGANKITIDSSLSSTSTNPVLNKVIKTVLDQKMPINGTFLSDSVFSLASAVQTTAGTNIGRAILNLGESGVVLLQCANSDGTNQVGLVMEPGILNIKGLTDPINDSDAASKHYVDTTIDEKLGVIENGYY